MNDYLIHVATSEGVELVPVQASSFEMALKVGEAMLPHTHPGGELLGVEEDV